MNSIADTITVGAPNSEARYGHSPNACMQCIRELPKNLWLQINTPFQDGQCYICEAWVRVAGVKIKKPY